jgi:tetratricopeptide (TPR) repeat protein
VRYVVDVARCPTCHRRLADDAVCPIDGDSAVAWRGAIALAGDALLWSAQAPAIPGYELGEALGSGGFAEVWAATGNDGQPVAIKVARARTAAARARLAAELDALMSIGAPAVPKVYDADVDAKTPYLVLERIHNPPLSEALTQPAAMWPTLRVRYVAGAIVRALVAVHEAGFVHCDLKPENIFVDEGTGQGQLVDFGLARAGDDSAAIASAIAGTPEYMSPEQLRGWAVDATADIYGFGVVLYELLCGRPPFVAAETAVEYAHLATRPPPPSRYGSVSADLEKLALRCLEKDRARRPPSARELLSLLESSGDREATAIAPIAIGGGERPVVLAAIAGAITPQQLTELAGQHGGFVVDRRDSSFLVCFATESRDPISDASALADALVDTCNARVTLHLTRAYLRPRTGSPPLIAGADIEDRETWQHEHDHPGVRVTPAFEAAVPRTTEVMRPTLLERDGLLADARASAIATLQHDRPGLVTIYGASGSGKSRVADEIAAVAEEMGFELTRDHGADIEAVRERAELVPQAVILDDIDSAAEELRAAVEYATLDGTGSFWAVAIADSEHRDPRWGRRAVDHRELTIEPLGTRALERIARELLAEVDFVSDEETRYLIDWSGGSPRALSQLIAGLRDQGALRPRKGGAVELRLTDLPLPTETSNQWIALRELQAMPPDLAQLVKLCALIGDEIDADAVAYLQQRLDQTSIDPDIGFFQLVGRGVLEEDGDRLRFARPGFRKAVEQSLPTAVESLLHARMFDYWERRDPIERGDMHGLEALARHADALGRDDVAANAYVHLGDDALRAHQPARAERCYSAALARDEVAGELRARALCGRGRARYRLDRANEAVDDLRQARDHGDERLSALALLEEATALDWLGEIELSAERTEEARARIESLDDAALEARLLCARGRSAWRAERIDDAVELLSRSTEAALACNDYDALVVSLLLLGPALVRAGRLDDAEARFTQVIELCSRAGDELHLCAAYGNRMFLWSARMEPEQGRDDLRQARELARRVGHPLPERNATYNLAEDLFWSGENDTEAMALAERARSLADRFLSPPAPEDALLVARIACANQRPERAREQLDWFDLHIASEGRSPTASIQRAMLELVVAGGSTVAWEALVDRARPDVGGDDLLEVLYFRARFDAPGREQALADAKELLPRFPIWEQRFAELANQGRE